MTQPAPDVTTETTVTTTESEKTFTQAEVDRIAGDRAARVKASFADYSDLKAKADKLAKIEAANATENELAVKAAREEGRAEVLADYNSRMLNAEARALAAAARARNPVIAVKSLDLSGVKVSDDGTVDSAAIKAAIADLQKTDAYLFGDPPVVNPNMDGGVRPPAASTGNSRADDLAQIEADMKAGARRT